MSRFVPSRAQWQRWTVGWSCVALLGLPVAQAAPAASSTANFRVKANPTMADGNGWRGMQGIFLNVPLGGAITKNMKNAPSLVLCTVAMEGTIDCPGAAGVDAKNRYTSPCHLSFDCDFKKIPLPEGDFVGIVTLSMGIVNTVFVDAVVFTRNKTDEDSPEFEAFDARMHEAVNRLSPTTNRDERQRRQRPFQLMKDIDYCASSLCELRQSELQMKPR